jgi:ABC-type uncharacterized transport system substrate-binding protein
MRNAVSAIRANKIVAKLFLACLVFLALALNGCTGKPPVLTKIAPPAKQVPEGTRPEKTRLQSPAIIVLSDSGEIFRTLSEQLLRRLGQETKILVLSDEAEREKLPSLLARHNGPLIAVGLEAAMALIPQADGRDVIFAMVFNHGDYRLLQRGMIGVSMLPPPAQVLNVLKELSPDTTRIIMPSGPNIGNYPALAREEAAKLGMSLVAQQVGSDKELLLLVKKLDRTTQAVWLLPDNRIMSNERLRQVMAVNLKSSRRTVVFSPSLFRLGGLVSAEYNLAAIAETVAEITGRTPADRAKLKGTMRQPAAGALAINGTIAETLGLKISPALEKLVLKGGAQ